MQEFDKFHFHPTDAVLFKNINLFVKIFIKYSSSWKNKMIKASGGANTSM